MAPNGLTDERAMVMLQELVRMQMRLVRMMDELETKVGTRSVEFRAAMQAEKKLRYFWMVIEGRVTDGEQDGN